MTKFPLCEQAGLEVVRALGMDNEFSYVRAQDVERMLREAPDVINSDDFETWSEAERLEISEHRHLFTRKGKVVCIQSIARDTPESLLKAFVAEVENERGYDFEVFCQLRDRARKVLEGR